MYFRFSNRGPFEILNLATTTTMVVMICFERQQVDWGNEYMIAGDHFRWWGLLIGFRFGRNESPSRITLRFLIESLYWSLTMGEIFHRRPGV